MMVRGSTCKHIPCTLSDMKFYKDITAHAVSLTLAVTLETHVS